MRGLTPQQWFLLTFLVLGLLLNLLVRTLGKRRGPGPEPTGDRATLPPDVSAPLPRRERVTTPPHPPAPVTATSPPLPPHPAPRAPGLRRRARGLRLDSREARRAIVLMAVLGPCRAAAPRGDEANPGPPP